MARAILLKLTTIFQTDAVVTRGDMTIGNTHVFRVVEVDAVTIADLQVVEQVNAVVMGLRIKGFVKFLPGNRISLLTSVRRF